MDYGKITSDHQQDILLTRRRKAIAVFEKDRVSTIETSQRRETKRFLNNLKRSEMILKEHESTKQTFFARHSSQNQPESPRIQNRRTKNHSSSFSGSAFTESCRTPEISEVSKNRAFSGRLKQINDRINVPYVKVSSYTRDDLKRPSTSLELKRKAWEKVSKHLDDARSLRPCSADFIAKCEENVPRNVREARKKLREITKVRLLSQLPPAPPRIDVHKVQEERRVTERIEKEIVGEFCQSLDELKVVLPTTFCWMDVNEVYLKNANIHKRNEIVLRKDEFRDEQQNFVRKEKLHSCDIKSRRRRKGQ